MHENMHIYQPFQPIKKEEKMKSLLTIAIFSMIVCSCSTTNKITSVNYVSKSSNLVSSGFESPEKEKLLLVCYNKYFNQERYSSEFVIQNKLDKIDYGKNMAVEIFLGKNANEIANLKVDKIEENKDNIKVHYSFDTKENKMTQTPFIIVLTEKSRKPALFFENGKEVKMPSNNVYIKN